MVHLLQTLLEVGRTHWELATVLEALLHAGADQIPALASDLVLQIMQEFLALYNVVAVELANQCMHDRRTGGNGLGGELYVLVAFGEEALLPLERTKTFLTSSIAGTRLAVM